MKKPAFSAIIYCPVCTTNHDIDQTGWVELECNNCATIFKILVDADVVAEHSMY